MFYKNKTIYKEIIVELLNPPFAPHIPQSLSLITVALI